MVERLCRRYGTPLQPAALAANGKAPADAAVQEVQLEQEQGEGQGLSLYAFPTLEQLAAATEEQLRADGFGYR